MPNSYGNRKVYLNVIMAAQEFILYAISVLVLIIVTLGLKSRIRERKVEPDSELVVKRLPGPVTLPLIGSLIQIALAGKTGQLYERYHNICKRYGRIMGARIGCLNLAVVEDYATAREIGNSPVWTARFPSGPEYRVWTFGKEYGLFMSRGENWKEMRRFVIRTLREFGFGELNIAEQFLAEELEYFTQYLDGLREKSNDTLKMNSIFKIPQLNIIWRIVVGYRIEYDDKEIHKVMHLVEQATTVEFGLHPFYAFPWLRYVPGANPMAATKESFKQIYAYLKVILDERRTAGIDEGTNTNFMDKLIQKIDEEKHNPSTCYTEEQLLCTCGDLLAAALDTTSNSTDFALIYMLKYPEVQRQVHEELDRVVGRYRTPNVLDRANLPYTEATMLETFRYSNVVPTGARTSACDTMLNGYHVPKNTFAVLNYTIIHMDKEIWGDPEAFRPERFLDPNNKVIRDTKLLSFGSGKRLCIGHTMAKVTWLAFFASVLQRYTLEVSEEHPTISTVPINGFTNTARDFYCTLKLRY